MQAQAWRTRARAAKECHEVHGGEAKKISIELIVFSVPFGRLNLERYPPLGPRREQE